jgi:hypothetical protein
MMTFENKNKNTGRNGLDEKGHPLPSKNPDGGTPICPSGYKIDYDFDVFDPLNPPFRCIPDMMSQNQINKIMNNLNHPSNNITRILTLPPAAGGGSSRTRRRRRMRTHAKHRHRRPSSRRTRHRHRHRRHT